MPRANVSEKYLDQLRQLGIYRPIQALYYFPKSVQYMHIQDFSPVLREGYFRGVVQERPRIVRRGKVRYVRFRFLTNNTILSVIVFHQTYLANVLKPNMPIIIYAKKAPRNWVASKIFYRTQELQHESQYSLLKGMRQAKFRKYLRACLEEVNISNFLPDSLHNKYEFINRKQAFINMHFPRNVEDRTAAIRYFKYEEAFLFYLRLFVRKQEMQQATGKSKSVSAQDVAIFKETLPYILTEAQDRVIKEILGDFHSPYLMYRLLQGDVGSGKTIVALLVAFLQIRCGYQVVMLAPTTILAQQHLQEAIKYLQPLGVQIGFLRSQMSKIDRQQLVTGLGKGSVQLVIGTHALLEEDIQFANLGLAIIDEQQRFGVKQRKILRQKGKAVDMLYMSATPIPRTLAISVFGDMSVSIIDELPAGRQKISTLMMRKRDWAKMMQIIMRTIARDEQVYVVCPLIEASEKMDLGDLSYVYAKLRSDLPADVRIALLHGKQKNEEKQAIINDFVLKNIHVLVSTTVVEVGVHVDDATLMIIYDAQQFGLSQLHQLRGRIGRSTKQGECILVSDQQNERLKLLENSQDGFFLAQQDLTLRGPGDFFGLKQSGLPSFRLINLLEDLPVLEAAKADVQTVFKQLPQLKEDELQQYAKIKEYVTLQAKQIEDYID